MDIEAFVFYVSGTRTSQKQNVLALALNTAVIYIICSTNYYKSTSSEYQAMLLGSHVRRIFSMSKSSLVQLGVVKCNLQYFMFS